MDTNKLLNGAEFKLRNEAGKWVTVDEDGKVTGWEDDEENGSVLVSENGLFSIIGLDAGTYYLKETKAPVGYNLLTGEKEVIITAAHKEVSSEAATTLNGTLSPNVKVTVENNQGTTLPETGGMGTTLFYVFGSLLAVGAIVLLVTKKRMNEE